MLFVDTWHLFNKYVRISLRAPLWLMFNLIQPLIWLIIFGQLFKNMAQLPGFPAGSYIDFFVPGVLIMTVLFGSSWSGVSLLREITAGTVDRMLVAPTSRVAIVLSRVLHSTAQVVLQTLIILAVAWAIGATLTSNIGALISSLVPTFLLGLGFAALSNGLAIVVQREEPLVVIGNMMTLPLMFFSSAMIPKSFMPEWIQMLSRINPIDYAVEGVRAALAGNIAADAYIWGVGVLTVFAGVALAWAVNAFGALRD